MEKNFFKSNILFISTFILFFICSQSFCQQTGILETFSHYPNINELLMKYTYKIEVTNKNGNIIRGTAFIIYKIDSITKTPILITAKHTLIDIDQDYIILDLRKKEMGEYLRYRFTIQIRNNGKPLWFEHPDTTIDVAAIKINLTFLLDTLLISQYYLATDSIISKFNIGPGDELNCVGFPYGVTSNEYGFPILKSGKIASYPILPTTKFKYFLFDCEVFPANSGSAVCFSTHYRNYIEGEYIIYSNAYIQYIVGILVSKIEIEQKILLPDLEINTNKSLQIAKVIPSTYILELLNQMK